MEQPSLLNYALWLLCQFNIDGIQALSSFFEIKGHDIVFFDSVF